MSVSNHEAMKRVTVNREDWLQRQGEALSRKK